MAAPPTLLVSPAVQSIGTVATDSMVNTQFSLTNVGGKPLVIHKIDASCGCTTAQLTKMRLRPGERETLNVKLDTSIKLGQIEKTIDIATNDPIHPVTAAKLTGNVIFKMQGHERIQVKDPLVLFKGKCASCHVDQGKGKTGKALFMADCAMCHGSRAQGAVAPTLMKHNWQTPSVQKAMRYVVANGSPQSPEMPPYSKAKGGPLTDDEIDSIMTYLRFEHAEQAAEAKADRP
jgi:mono/diheme cytochrome c family protein